MSDASFKIDPPIEHSAHKTSKRPWVVIIVAGLLFLLSILCSTFFLFASLYNGEWLLAGLIFVLGFAAMAICYGIWSSQLWAWYAVVFLLGMSTLADLLIAVLKKPYPAGVRGVLSVILLAIFVSPRVRETFKT